MASEYATQHTKRKRMGLLTLHDVQAALERRNPRKAAGPSGIPISVWQAGGESSARLLLALLNTTRVMGRSAVAMRGGRVQELYQNRGDRNETKSHRGILVQHLPGAMHASFLKRDIDEHCMKFIHETQCGCAKGRSTCMAGQIVELAANFKGRGMCWGRLYLDLSAAFDSILREFLIADSTYDVQLLQSSLKALNVSDEMCDQIVREAITEKNLIRRTGASAQLGDLVGDMHTGHFDRVAQTRCQPTMIWLSLHNKDAHKNAASVKQPKIKPTQMVRIEKMVKTLFHTIAIRHTQHVRLKGPDTRWSDIIMTMKEKQQRDSKQTRSVHIPNY